MSVRGWIYPSRKAASMMAHSSSRLVVGSWLKRFSTQAFSHSAGQMRPVNSGKGLVLVSRRKACSQSPFIQCVVPFRRLVAQRTGPVAEGHAAVHAARGLQLAFAGGERLLHLAKVVDAVVNGTVARLLAVYL